MSLVAVTAEDAVGAAATQPARIPTAPLADTYLGMCCALFHAALPAHLAAVAENRTKTNHTSPPSTRRNR